MQRAWIAHLLPFERAYAAGEVALAPAPPGVAAPAGLLPLAFAEAPPPPAAGARRGAPEAAAAKEAGEARPRRRARLAAGGVAPEDLVGRRVGVWRPDAGAYLFGELRAYDAAAGRHALRLDGGGEEPVALAEERWVLETKPEAGAPAPAAPAPPSPAAAAAAAPAPAPLTALPAEARAGTALVAAGPRYRAYSEPAADGAGFELFADLPEFSRADVGVRAFSRGLVRLSARRSSEAGAAGAADVVLPGPLDFSADVALPGPLDTRSAQALFGGGRLYVRVGAGVEVPVEEAAGESGGGRSS